MIHTADDTYETEMDHLNGAPMETADLGEGAAKAVTPTRQKVQTQTIRDILSPDKPTGPTDQPVMPGTPAIDPQRGFGPGEQRDVRISQNIDYDMEGFKRDNPDAQIGPEQHYPDTYKLPNHPTFSDESKYHGKEGAEGGHWDKKEDGTYSFTPGKTNLEHFTPDQLRDYFHRVEPNNELKLPGPGGVTINRDHDVPYIAGADKNNDTTIYVDKNLPKTVAIGGVTFDPAHPAAMHELAEKPAMEYFTKVKGMPDDIAYELAHHVLANPTEDTFYAAHGIDQDEVNKFWKQQDHKDESEGKGDEPKDLYKKPYTHADKPDKNFEETWQASELKPEEQQALTEYIEHTQPGFWAKFSQKYMEQVANFLDMNPMDMLNKGVRAFTGNTFFPGERHLMPADQEGGTVAQPKHNEEMTAAQRVFDAFSAFHGTESGEALPTPTDKQMMDYLTGAKGMQAGIAQNMLDKISATKYLAENWEKFLRKPPVKPQERPDWDKKLETQRVLNNVGR